MPGAVVFFELFEIYAFGAFYRNHVVILLFIVANEKILGVATRIGNVDTAEFVHIKNRFVLGGFEFDIVFFEIIVGFLLVHAVYYSMIWGYGFTIHGSAAVPVPLMVVVPALREMAGRTPYAESTLNVSRMPPEYRTKPNSRPFE